MKLFTTKQIAELDKYTIENEPISDVDLMERASTQITGWLVKNFSSERKMIFFVGPGNNGGDALAIARQMFDLDFMCEVYLLDFGKDLKGSPAINLKRLKQLGTVNLFTITNEREFPDLHENDVIIDGMFGSGLTRSLQGFPAAIIQKINRLKNTVVSIDIPSGLMGENNSENIPENIVQANFTLTFQFPKLSFFFAENEKYTGTWEVLPIGLHPDGIANTDTLYSYMEKKDILPFLPQRRKFDHKGTYGHALLIAGSYGKMGAAVLASKACLRSGVGLLTAHVPRLGCPIIQTAVPEAMVSVDQHDSIFTEVPDLKMFSAIGAGPGLGKKSNCCKALHHLLEKAKVPLVLDADAINILAERKEWLEKLPENTVLTPHPGEFKRLVGETQNSFQNIQKQIWFSKKYKVVLVLKGACTSISVPSGKIYFNSTGNPGMATAGSGDALTGIITALLAQGMSSKKAAITGVFLHGLAGDLARAKKSDFSLVASDIIDHLGLSFLEML